jgi:hypothetical protein
MTFAPAGRTTLSALVLWCLVSPAHAQLGGLIKKKVTQVTATPNTPQAGAPDVYSNDLLELTEARLIKVIAGKQAGRQFANSPRGAAALRARWEATEERWADLSNKNSTLLNAWADKKSVIMACRDSAFDEVRQRHKEAFERRAPTDRALIMKMLAISQAVQAAEQRGDTALVRKLEGEMEALTSPSPTPTDSAAVTHTCGDVSAAPAIATQVEALYLEKESLKQQMQRAEVEVSRLEQTVSGMNDKQIAIACERIKEFIKRLKTKAAQGGFSAAELAALQQHIKDLEELCD